MMRRCLARLLLLALLPALAVGEWAFLSDQSQCRLQCLNGGVCAFLVRQPEVHKCICLIGMFDGDQCELPVAPTAGHSSEDNDAPNSVAPEGSEPEAEEEAAAAYEDEWTALKEEEATDNEAEAGARRSGAAGQTQRFLPETNTLGDLPLEHFAESRGQPVAAVRDEENYEEPALKQTKPRAKGKAGKTKKKKLRPTEPPTPEMEEEEAARDGWMLTRRGGGHRSAADRRAPQQWAVHLLMAAGTGLLMALLLLTG